VRMGINLGPVKLVKDINGHPNIIGDGINVSQRIMSFARPGQIVVSRSYYDVVSNLASEYAKLFQYEGSRTDKHVREHEIYVVGHHEDAIQKARAGMADRASTTSPSVTHPKLQRPAGTATVTLSVPSFVQDKRKLMMLAGGLGALVIVLAILVAVKKPSRPADTLAGAPAATVEGAKTAEVAPPAKPAVAPKPDAKILSPEPSAAVIPPAAPTAAPAAGAVDAPKGGPAKPEPGKAEPAKRDPAKGDPAKGDPAKGDPAKVDPTKLAASTIPPATLVFAVQPWGEVFVNGKSRGVVPPMKSLKLEPGKYKIEVRNTTFPAHVVNFELKARDEITVRHRFQ